tara:strand:- start:12560 stop:13267 length:708 start_codon:yes stop_codon:yes gene_type:complete
MFAKNIHMKRIILLILVFVQLSFVAAQSLVISGQNIVSTVDPCIDTQSHLTVRNTSSQSLNIICAKNVISTLQGADDYFCWGGQCFGSTVIISPTTTTIDSEEASTEFAGHFNAFCTEGEGVIEYCFYPDTDITDSACVTITYNGTSSTSINETAAFNEVGDFYPNPASEMVYFNFKGSLATLKLIDILGNEVKSIVLSEEGVQKLDLTDMTKGIYFGNLLVNDEVVSIKKLIVK